MSTDAQKETFETSYLPDELIEQIVEYIVETENVKVCWFAPLLSSIANNAAEQRATITITTHPTTSESDYPCQLVPPQ